MREGGGLGALVGSAPFWVAIAAVVFALAAILAFALNGDGGSAAEDGESAQQALMEEPEAEQQAPPEQTEREQEQVTPAAPESEPGPLAEPEPEPVERPSEPAEPQLTGYVFPIEGVCLTQFEGHFPGVPREYRNGTHEGMDFYSWASCVNIDHNTPVLAVRDGTVMRADLNYTDLTEGEYYAAEAQGFQGEEILDMFRGRQIWIDHGDGVISRYAHLGAIAAGIQQGTEVQAGQVIAFVGESGTPPSLFAPGTDEHLHFEIWVDGAYLGQGLTPTAGRNLYADAFGVERIAEP